MVFSNRKHNLGFEKFLRLIGKTFHKNALKKASRKKEKEKVKPWITRRRRYSLKIHTNNLSNKTREIRKYRSKITGLLPISRQSQYRKYFSDIKKNSKGLWQGIHEIIYSKNPGKTNSPSSLLINPKYLTNQQDMTEHFNNFFTFIGKNLKETISSTRKHYAHLKTPKKNHFSIKPTKQVTLLKHEK